MCRFKGSLILLFSGYWDFFPKIKRTWVKGNYSGHLMWCFRMSEAMLTLPYMPSWLTEWHVCIYRSKDILCRCEPVVRFSEAVWCFTIHDNIDLTNVVTRRIAVCRLSAKGSWGVALTTLKADKFNTDLHSLRTMRRKDTLLASCKF